MISSRTGRLAGLALVGALGLAACGSDGEPTPTAGWRGRRRRRPRLQHRQRHRRRLQRPEERHGRVGQRPTSRRAPARRSTTSRSAPAAGAQQFIAGTVDFAGSDSALKADEQAAADARCGARQGAEPADGGRPDRGRLQPAGRGRPRPRRRGASPRSSAAQITTWDDPAIKALNPAATLPSTPIQAFHRGDGSGTTDNFRSTSRPRAPRPGRSSAGVGLDRPRAARPRRSPTAYQRRCKSTPGAITYVEQSFAENAGLNVAKIATGAGEPVELTADNVAKAVAGAKVTGTGNDLTLALDYATKADGRLPDRAGDLRDRLREGPAGREGRAGQGAS